MYKVFFNDRIVFINNTFIDTDTSNGIVSIVFSAGDVDLALENFLNDSSKGNLFLTGDSAEEVFRLFMKKFKVVEAAGGLVFNQFGQLLCIYRWNKWDLPKGKIEKHETSEAAAVREVEEETGISGVQVESFKATTYHLYESPFSTEMIILKPTYWFVMNYSGNEILRPQIKEDILKAEWFSKTDLNTVRNNTYASLRELLDD